MENPRLIICAKERDLIMAWIIGGTPPDISIRHSLDKLYLELEQADIRKEDELPKDVVRVGSIVTIEAPSGRKEGKTIRVYRHVKLHYSNGKGGRTVADVSATAGYLTCK